MNYKDILKVIVVLGATGLLFLVGMSIIRVLPGFMKVFGVLASGSSI